MYRIVFCLIWLQFCSQAMADVIVRVKQVEQGLMEVTCEGCVNLRVECRPQDVAQVLQAVGTIVTTHRRTHSDEGQPTSEQSEVGPAEGDGWHSTHPPGSSPWELLQQQEVDPLGKRKLPRDRLREPVFRLPAPSTEKQPYVPPMPAPAEPAKISVPETLLQRLVTEIEIQYQMVVLPEATLEQRLYGVMLRMDREQYKLEQFVKQYEHRLGIMPRPGDGWLDRLRAIKGILGELQKREREQQQPSRLPKLLPVSY